VERGFKSLELYSSVEEPLEVALTPMVLGFLDCRGNRREEEEAPNLDLLDKMVAGSLS
jgi:hypothetical protein